MKLYYSRGSCSLAPHIVLEELGLPYEKVPVDISKEPSPDFLKVNPMAAVPVLEMENKQNLTELAVIIQYLADRKPEAALAPPAGTLERYRLQEWLNFIASEIHKGFGPLWYAQFFVQDPAKREEARSMALGDLARKFDVIVGKLGSRPFLMSSGYTVADAYLFAILNWSHPLHVDLSRWPALTAFMDRVKARPAVMKALKDEHLA